MRVALLYPNDVVPRLVEAAANDHGIPKYRVFCDADARKLFESHRHRTLFLALSDGARLDAFRRVNENTISNEQVVVGTQLDGDKWKELRQKLSSRLGEASTFRTVYLIDDFTASGTSFIRKKRNGEWGGKLVRFLASDGCISHFDENWQLVIYHLIMTEQAQCHIESHVREFGAHLREEDLPIWGSYEVKEGYKLKEDFPLSEQSDGAMIALSKKYYDSSIETEHTSVGGEQHIGLGYAKCALPLVLDHNCPNNSIALLWAHTDGANGNHAMRPLFRRRQRHS